MNVLITGIAGTGKSTLVKALNERGIVSVDLHDVPGLFFWQDTKTKERVLYSPGVSQEWFESVDRLCDIALLTELLSNYDNAVFAGITSGSNQKEFLALFDTILLLQCSPETIIHRMQTRVNKSGYGKTKAEQDDNIQRQKEFDTLLLSLGATPISTEGDVQQVVEEILGVVRPKK
jgi:broad-specificity NMP kinase